MLRIIIVFGVLMSVLLILTILAPVTIAQEIENLVSNPDFDMDMNIVADWTIGAGGTLSIDKKEKFPIGQVMKAQIDAPGANDWEPEVHSKAFDVKNGTMYTCSFWAKADADKRPITVKYEQLDTWVGPSQNFSITDKEMTEYSFSPIMTMGSPPQVVIHIQFNKVKGGVWFAHFRVYEGKYVEDDLKIAGKPKAVSPGGKLAVTWGDVKSR
jgi:hypothetical protein